MNTEISEEKQSSLIPKTEIWKFQTKEEAFSALYEGTNIVLNWDDGNTPIKKNQERFQLMLARVLDKDVDKIIQQDIKDFFANICILIGLQQTIHFLSHLTYFDTFQFIKGNMLEDVSNDTIEWLVDNFNNVPIRSLEARVRQLIDEMFPKKQDMFIVFPLNSIWHHYNKYDIYNYLWPTNTDSKDQS